jgi:uncharacterized protein (TIGR00661 family)
MKILYAIQGTGNGHLSRAMDIIPALQQFGEVTTLLSGIQVDLKLPYQVDYRLEGLSFIFGKKGGIDIYNTLKKSNIKQLNKDIKSIPVENYDLVINDFEPVSAWACYLKKIPCIGLSHQFAVAAKGSPKPKKFDPIGKWVLNNYAPVSSGYGFHFKQYNKEIFTPVIRQQVRQAEIKTKEHYTVYLPAFSDTLLMKKLKRFKDTEWHVFSKHSKNFHSEKNVHVFPIQNDTFINSMARSTGILCGAGFETPAEALHLQKKLMVVPMKGQYEQQCNAAALKELGIPVIKNLKAKAMDKIGHWLDQKQQTLVYYPDITNQIISGLIAEQTTSKVYEIPELSNGAGALASFLGIS